MGNRFGVEALGLDLYMSNGSTVDGEIVTRRICQIPDELIPRIFAVAGNLEPRAAGIRITPPHLGLVSAIIDQPLDTHACHWLGKAVT